MKKILSNIKTVIGLLGVTIILLGFYIYMIARPISYGMEYYAYTEYEGIVFECKVTFNADGTMHTWNTSNIDLDSRYYYKDGYVFFTSATTDEAYDQEVAWINANFEEAINTPFYADEINAFGYVASEGDGYSLNYDCKGAVVFAIAAGVVVLMFAGLTTTSFVLSKKTKRDE